MPVPALAAVCTSSVFLIPLLAGLIAGSSEAVGELTGYFLGYTGLDIRRWGHLYQRLETWMRRRGWLVLFLVSLIPNPIFDVVGVAAGALRYPLLGFPSVVWVGQGDEIPDFCLCLRLWHRMDYRHLRGLSGVHRGRPLALG